ncbi:MAG: peptidase [Cycloclasticus sp. symbiont of Poecilosclerida sp. N]|nr:MAG: peptidase [Cycloclasticus sp. symbiont of Poecilosclerida sp. N]
MTHALFKINIIIKQQKLFLYETDVLLKSYKVCTAKNGAGELFGSERTPRGRHIVRAKIGDGAPLGSVFVGRRLTDEIHSLERARKAADRDWILTRILWLSGVEKGKNRLGKVDTMRRYIYIHGAPDELMCEQPSSHGCIRMFNNDVVDLYERISVGTEVLIT